MLKVYKYSHRLKFFGLQLRIRLIETFQIWWYGRCSEHWPHAAI